MKLNIWQHLTLVELRSLDATSMYFQATYKAMDNLQAIVRHSMNKHEDNTSTTAVESEISNTYIGMKLLGREKTLEFNLTT